ncbi:hypothetical protein U0035_00475 [Niabella yanshanensis]|uniref:Uncharacterized protein n=1 Tax=Niabella yanshanensis TaxID=577386 RepID=A0ABZ0W9E6_9BACT|nr:hypothetical protein [Niabella yanshanensis]WQD38620.1 hypothetical protein U0035_00475 [Niabella yanshanensis]
MRKELSYEQVILMLKYQSDEMLYQGITLLLFVHEVLKEQTLMKQGFTFTQYEEGHFLVTGVNEALSANNCNEPHCGHT